MAKAQENGSKILLGLKGCEVEEVRQDAAKILDNIIFKLRWAEGWRAHQVGQYTKTVARANIKLL